jgi:DNA invertase Pin-like site-specific DNA recombinase
MIGVFAEFERAMIVNRVHAGLKRARSESDEERRKKGKKAFGRPKVKPAVEENIKAALAAGELGMLKIAAKYKVGSGTVQRIKAEMSN